MRILRPNLPASVAVWIAALNLMPSGPPALAAKADDRLEEFVVTTRRREENLQSVPLSITAFSNQDLLDRGIESLAQLAAQTPGLEFASTGSIAGTRPIIRGLSQQTRVGDEPNVASFIDGVYAPGFSGSTLLFDALSRIEVVRGPQSAVYGRNSFAGAINYVSEKPSPEFDVGFRTTLASAEQRSLSAFVTGPVAGEALSLRLDGAFRDTGGTNKNSVNGEALANRQTDFARLSARMSIGAILIDAAAQYTKDEATPTPVIVNDPFAARIVGKPGGSGSPFEQGFVEYYGQPDGTRIGRRIQGEINDETNFFSLDPDATNERAAYLYTLNIDWDIDERFSLVSTSGYQTRDLQSLSDVDNSPQGGLYLYGIRVPPTEGIIGEPLFVQGLTGSQEDRDEFSTDLRLSFDGSGRWSWLVGTYYSQETFHDMRIRRGTPALQYNSGACPEEIYGRAASRCIVDYAFPDLSVTSETVHENQYFAVYGSFDFDITETLSLSVEGRKTWEEKTSNNTLVNLPSNRLPRGDLGKVRFDYFAPRINLSWQTTDELLLYALVAKGIKTGGFNGDAVLEEDIPFYPETNWTYEAGWKWTFWEDRARFNLSAYYIDWQNQQITRTQEDSNSPIVGNITAAENLGFESEIWAAPTDSLTFNFGYSYSDPKYKVAVFESSAGWVDCVAIGTIDCVPELDINGNPTGQMVSSGRGDGNQLVNTSVYLLNAGAEFHRPINVGEWNVYVRGDYSYRSKRYVDSLNIGWVPSLSTVNLRGGFRSPRWTVEGFCDNVLDDGTPTTAFPPRDFLGVPRQFTVVRNGRICGMTLGYLYR